jgi:excisionase family DNA binding protein
MKAYLNTEQAAAYLGIGERKLYELVATGAVPCSKVTGKWLFPRAELDRWIEQGLIRPAGFTPSQPPPIIGGSHDPLLEWAARRSASGLALLSVGSGEGLALLAAGKVAVAAVHFHAGDGGPDADGNREALLAEDCLADAVLIGFARREQGLLLPPGNPRGVGSLAAAVAAGLRFARRQPAAGAELLLARLLRAIGLDVASVRSSAAVCATGDDLAFAVRAGDADCGIASRAVAAANGLAFLPLVWEHFDLAMRRRTYFEPGPQALLALMRSEDFRRHATLLGGLDVTGAGAVRLSR